ncbi:MAG: hypothetical protein SF029_08100 [bacterium]|nr:hypothetical protein [bacterium]
MVTLHLKGRITENGRLEVELPEGTPPGEVTVAINLQHVPHTAAWEEIPWTPEEIALTLSVKAPKTGAEIAAMMDSGELEFRAWQSADIPDAVEWVRALRRGEIDG